MQEAPLEGYSMGETSPFLAVSNRLAEHAAEKPAQASNPQQRKLSQDHRESESE